MDAFVAMQNALLLEIRINVEGMIAENQVRSGLDEAPAYREEAFRQCAVEARAVFDRLSSVVK